MNKSNGYLIFLTLVATLGGLLFGYDTAVISGTVKYLDLNFVVPLGLDETAASSLLGFAVSSALIGCVIGGLIGGVMATRLGRKRSLMAAAVLFIVSAVGSAYPEMGFGDGDPHEFLPHFIVYRIIGGIGVGLASMLSPMYIAEMAPAGRRGSLVSWNQFAIIFGMLVVYFVNYGIALLYGFVGSLLGIFGDLCFSIVKRQTGIKDYGNLIPGHGGVLDRFDSLTLVAPAMEVLLVLLPMAV